MRILITGANGCLGHALVGELLGAGHEVIALVRPGRTLPPAIRLRPVEIDLSVPLDARVLPDRCDAVIHAAQSRRQTDSAAAALDIFRINTAAAVELAGYALRAGACHFVFASSGSVYVPQAEPIPETAASAPISFYAASKLAAEQLLQPFGSHLGVIVARLFFLYGPGQKDKLVTKLVDRLRQGKVITLNGDDGLRLTPTYSLDAARALRLGIEQGWSGVFNVASPHVVSLRQLSLILAGILNAAPNFERVAPRSAGELIPDLGRLGQRMDLSTFLSPADGLRRTFAEIGVPPQSAAT